MVHRLKNMVAVLSTILVLITVLQFVNANVEWKIDTNPIVFLEDVTLTCYSSQKNICDSGGRKWKGGRENSLLTFDEGPVNQNKYSSKCVKYCFTLTIKNFSEEDFNKNYTCSYGFDQYTANLTTKNYKIHPMTGTINVSNIVSGSSDSIDVQFLKVYPFPQCLLHIYKDVFIKPQKVWQNFTSYFYRGKITFEYKLTEEGCGQNLSIVCQDASNNSVKLPYKTLLKHCLVSHKNTDSEVVVVCISVSLVLIAGGIFIFFLYKTLSGKHKKEEHSEHGQTML